LATSLDGTKEDYVGVLHKHTEDQVMELINYHNKIGERGVGSGCLLPLSCFPT